MWSRVSNSNKYVYYGYNIKHNLKAVAAVTEIKNAVTKGQEAFFTERVISAASVMQLLSVLLFIGTFIAMIFLLQQEVYYISKCLMKFRKISKIL